MTRKEKQKTMRPNDDGVIMMETLITLPVYFIMLAGLFWLGELCIARLTLTHAELLRIWESGTRYGITGVPDRGIFSVFPPEDTLATGVDGLTAWHALKDDYIRGFEDKPSELNWGTKKSGFVSLNTRRSEWSWGIVNFTIGEDGLWAFLGKFSEEERITSGKYRMTMLSRVDGRGKPLPQQTLFRREPENGNRAGSTPYTGGWNAIYSEAWDFFGDHRPPKRNVGILGEYGGRHSQFNDWSI